MGARGWGETRDSWGRGERRSAGEGPAPRAQDRGEGGRGLPRRSSHSPPGGKRRRRSRSPCSGWGAAAAGVQGPGCGRRVAGPLGGWGLRRPRRARADPGGVALTRDDGGLGVSRPSHCALGQAAPQPSRVVDAAPHDQRDWRGGRVAAGGGGGGGGEREPDRLPDLTPSSARVSGGRAGEPRGLSGNVV